MSFPGPAGVEPGVARLACVALHGNLTDVSRPVALGLGIENCALICQASFLTEATIRSLKQQEPMKRCSTFARLTWLSQGHHELSTIPEGIERNL